MAKKINLGKVGITTEGNYDPSKAYEKLCCVLHNGVSWVSTTDVPAGNAPDEGSAFWQKVSDRGEQGPQGPVGPQGNSAFDGTGVEIVNNLTQGGEAAVLSAEQGKVLDAKVTELSEEVVEVAAENDRHYSFATNGGYENLTSKIGMLKKGATVVNRGVAFVAFKDSARTEQLTIRTGDTIIVDGDKRFIIAGSASGTIDFDYKITEALSNTESLQKQLSNHIQVYDKALDMFSFDTSEYVQGYYQAGQGLVSSNYAISSLAYPIKKGDIVNIFPNGSTIQLTIIDKTDADFFVLKNINNITDELTYQSEYDGYLRIVARAGGQLISPQNANVVCSVNRTKDEIKEEETTNFGISKSVIDKMSVRVVNDSQSGTKMQFSNASIIDVDNELYPKIVRVNNGYVRYLNPIDMKNNHLVIRLRINRLDNGGYINVKVGNTAFPSNAYYYELARTHVNTIIGVWQDFTIPCLAYQTSTENIKFDDIDDIFIIATNAEVDVQYIGIKSNPLKKGIVTFTFDDGYTTQMDAAKTMCRKGVQGTYYVIKKAIDDNAEGYLTIPQLQQMAEQFNSDIQVHGNSPFDNETDESLLTIFRETQAMLKDNGISDGDHMSYPNGYHSERVVRLARQFFKSCRTILQNIPIETYPPYDRYRMRSVSAIVDSQVDKVKQYIDRCVENNTWLILTFHKMEIAPSGASDPSMYCSMAAFEEILNYACEKANVMSVAEVMNTSYVVA